MTRHTDPDAATRQSNLDQLLDAARDAHLERAIAGALRDLAARQRDLNQCGVLKACHVIDSIGREAARREHHAVALEQTLRGAS